MYECLNSFNKGSGASSMLFNGEGRMGSMMFGRGGGSSMMFMGGFWILVLLVVLFVTVKFFSNKQNLSSNKETPLDVLQKEYAKGNISESDYLERKNHL